MSGDELTGALPGDPAAVRAIGAEFGRIETLGVEVGRRLGSIARAAGDDLWQGVAAEAFRSTLDGLFGPLEKLADSHAMAKKALSAYSVDLEHAQDRAARAAAAGGQALAERDAALERAARDNAEAAAYGKVVIDARARVLAAQTQQVLSQFTDGGQAQQEEYRQSLRADQASAQAAQARQRAAGQVRAAEAAQARAEAERRLIASAVALRDTAAATAVRELDLAGQAGIRNRTWVEATVHTVGKVVLVAVNDVRDFGLALGSDPQFKQFLTVLDGISGLIAAAAPLVGLFCPVAGVAMVGASVLLSGIVLGGMLLANAAGNAGTDEVLLAAANLGVAAVLGGGGRILKLGGQIKRTLAYADNRTLSGLDRILFSGVTVAPKGTLSEAAFRLDVDAGRAAVVVNSVHDIADRGRALVVDITDYPRTAEETADATGDKVVDGLVKAEQEVAHGVLRGPVGAVHDVVAGTVSRSLQGLND